MDSHQLNHVSFLIIQAAIEVHRTLGPGLLENTYRSCLIYELRQRSLGVLAEQFVPICYKDVTRLANKPLGLLINFNVPVLVKGVKRIMNGCEGAALRSKQPQIASVPNKNGISP